ncbi:hypothetical protein Q5M85_10330 [Paraclostridium bifermentans]|nr:hypothetical protein [Paraclostridium bifermentans]
MKFGRTNQGNENGAPINEHGKSKYQRDANSEDSNIYRKLTEEELREIENSLREKTKYRCNKCRDLTYY